MWLRALDLRNLLTLVAGILTVVLALPSQFGGTDYSLFVGFGLICILCATWFLERRRRQQAVAFEVELVAGIFALLNEEIFLGDPQVRFTLWQRPGRATDFLVPWYRYRKAGRNVCVEADESNMRLRRGEGITGQAWNEAGKQMRYLPIPKFSSRPDMETFYVEKQDMPSVQAREISAFVLGVESSFSYAFVDEHGGLLGVLNVELQAPLVRKADGSLAFPRDQHGPEIPLDWEGMKAILKTTLVQISLLSDVSRGGGTFVRLGLGSGL